MLLALARIVFDGELKIGEVCLHTYVRVVLGYILLHYKSTEKVTVTESNVRLK